MRGRETEREEGKKGGKKSRKGRGREGRIRRGRREGDGSHDGRGDEGREREKQEKTETIGAPQLARTQLSGPTLS